MTLDGQGRQGREQRPQRSRPLFAQMVLMALRNLARSRTRSILTMIGVGGSVALFVSMTAVSGDLKRQLDETIAGSNIDVVIQEGRAATPVASRVPDEVIGELAKHPSIDAVSSVIIGSVKVPKLKYLFVFGVSSAEPHGSIADWLGAGITEGRMCVPGRKEVMVGILASRKLRLGVGDEFVVGDGESFPIVGIYWIGHGVLDGGVVMDIAASQDLLKRDGHVNMALIKAKDKKGLASLIRDLQSRYPHLSVMPASSLRRQIRAITMIDSFVIAVSVIAFVISAIMLLNTLLMALSEYTREIGILSAVGWPRSMIMQLVCIEAVTLAVAGGGIGFLASYPVLKMMALLPAIGPGWIPAMPSLLHGLVAVLISGFIGILSAIYPALFATRMRPADALRCE